MGFFDKLKKITSNLFSGFTEADEDFFEELEENPHHGRSWRGRCHGRRGEAAHQGS